MSKSIYLNKRSLILFGVAISFYADHVFALGEFPQFPLVPVEPVKKVENIFKDHKVINTNNEIENTKTMSESEIVDHRNILSQLAHKKKTIDVNNDGIPEDISFKNIKYGSESVATPSVVIRSTQKSLHFVELAFPAPAGRFSSMEILYLDQQKKYPSILLGTLGKLFAEQTPQLLLLNENGLLKAKSLNHVQLATRDIACVGSPFKANKQLCFFASYPVGPYERSALVLSTLLEVSQDGSVQDITAEVGLPFGGTSGRRFGHIDRYHGLYGISADFMDLDQNKLPDLVFVGQHSKMMAAFMVKRSDLPSGFSFSYRWFDQSDEYLSVRRISEPFDRLSRAGKSLPCFFVGMEKRETRTDDFIMCYQKADGQTSEQWQKTAIAKPSPFKPNPDLNCSFKMYSNSAGNASLNYISDRKDPMTKYLNLGSLWNCRNKKTKKLDTKSYQVLVKAEFLK